MRTVIVESPFAGDIARNIRYGRAALSDCLNRGEAPFASHLLYTQPGVLNDSDPIDRKHGIEAGLTIGKLMDATVVYVDLGISPGMQLGIDRAQSLGRPVEYRSIHGWDLVTCTDSACRAWGYRSCCGSCLQRS